MAHFTGRLTRVLATVTAVMTVTTGQPFIGYVCPDGQVRLFYTSGPNDYSPGPSLDPLQPGRRTATHQPRSTHKHVRPLLTHTGELCQRRGCDRTTLAEGVTSTIEDDETEVEGVAQSGWGPTVIDPVGSNWGMLKARHTLLPPTDLIISLCHFTC